MKRAVAALAVATAASAAASVAAEPQVEVGVDARLRYEAYDPTAFGRGPQDDDGYLLWRVQPWAEARGGRWRGFAELFAADLEGRNGGPRAADRNALDVGQAWVEWRPDASWTVRAGRQEIALGSGRLLAANDGANVRRRFDGLFVERAAGGTRWLAVASGLVDVRPGTFDDRSSGDRAMAGFGVVRGDDSAAHAAAYLLYARRPEALFGSPPGRQERYTLGVRVVRTPPSGRWEAELIAQGGEAGGREVAAWALAGEWRAPPGPGPRPWIKVSAASGDRNRSDSRVGGFDPLFPNPAYAGSIPLIGPTNALAFNPGVATNAHGWRLGLDVALLWRTETADGVYGFSGARIDDAASRARRIGALWSLTASRPLADGITTSTTLSRLDASPTLGPRGDTTAFVLNLIWNR